MIINLLNHLARKQNQLTKAVYITFILFYFLLFPNPTYTTSLRNPLISSTCLKDELKSEVTNGQLLCFMSESIKITAGGQGLAFDGWTELNKS